MGEECVVPPPLHVLPQTTAPQPGPLQGRREWGPLCPTALGMRGQWWEDGATKSCSQMDRNNPEAHPQPRTPRGGCMPRPAQGPEAAPSQDVQEGGAECGGGSSSGRRHAEAKRRRSAGQPAEVGPASGHSWGQCQVAPSRSKGGHLAGGGKKGVGNRTLCGRVIGAGAVHTPSLVLKLEQLGRGEGPEVAGQECVCDIGGWAGG